MTRVQVATSELAELRSAVLRAFPPTTTLQPKIPILAVDPGSVSTGWCVLTPDGAVHSGQGPPLEVVPAIGKLLEEHGRPVLAAFEAPFSLSAEQVTRGGRVSSVASVYAMGRALGIVEGGLARQLESVPAWRPKPMTWRSILGLNARASATAQTAREATTAAVLQWVRATTRLPFATARGRDEEDRAMAVALAMATLALGRSLHATARGDDVAAAMVRKRRARAAPARSNER